MGKIKPEKCLSGVSGLAWLSPKILLIADSAGGGDPGVAAQQLDQCSLLQQPEIPDELAWGSLQGGSVGLSQYVVIYYFNF